MFLTSAENILLLPVRFYLSCCTYNVLPGGMTGYIILKFCGGCVFFVSFDLTVMIILILKALDTYILDGYILYAECGTLFGFYFFLTEY